MDSFCSCSTGGVASRGETAVTVVAALEMLKQLGFLWDLHRVGAGQTRNWFSEAEIAGGLHLLLCPWLFGLVSCTVEYSEMIGCTEEEYEDSLVDQV